MTTTDNDWTTADLVALIQRADPGAAAEVIRALADRIERDADQVTDPRSLLVDLSHALASLASVVDLTVSDACDDHLAVNPTNRAHLDLTLSHIAQAAVGIEAIADGWI